MSDHEIDVEDVDEDEPRSNDLLLAAAAAARPQSASPIKADESLVQTDEEEEEEEESVSSNKSRKNKSGSKKGSGKTGKSGSSSGSGSSGGAPTNPQVKPRCNSEHLRLVDCHLETKELWDKFNELGTEMIITKTGR